MLSEGLLVKAINYKDREVKGYLCYASDAVYVVTKKGRRYKVRPETIARSTGVRDSKGALLFENDIILADIVYHWKHDKQEKISGRIRFKNGGFFLYNHFIGRFIIDETKRLKWGEFVGKNGKSYIIQNFIRVKPKTVKS